MNSTVLKFPVALAAALAAGLFLLPGAGHGQGAGADEPRFASCNAQASKKGMKKGRQRQEFLSSCLKGAPAAQQPAATKPAAKKGTPQQQAAERARAKQ